MMVLLDDRHFLPSEQSGINEKLTSPVVKDEAEVVPSWDILGLITTIIIISSSRDCRSFSKSPDSCFHRTRFLPLH